MLMIWFRRRYHAAAVAQRVKQVHCEKCACDFRYDMVRRGVGTQTSSFLGGEIARAAARGQATRRLREMLDTDSDLVPCPSCGWVQSDMIRHERKCMIRWVLLAGWIAFVAASTAAVIVYFNFGHEGVPGLGPLPTPLNLVGGGIMTMLLAVAARHAWTNSFDPNRHYPQPFAPIPGAPIAYQVDEQWPATKEPAQVDEMREGCGGSSVAQPDLFPPAAASEAHTLTASSIALPNAQLQCIHPPAPLQIERGGWVTLQLAKARFPSRCCRCLKETQRLDAVQCDACATASVPICDNCLQMRRRLVRLVHGGTATLGALAVVSAPGHHEPLQLLLGACAGAGIACCLSLTAVRFIPRPVRFAGYDAMRNTIRVRFRNRAFLRLLAEEGRAV